jgi:hypothetical protein
MGDMVGMPAARPADQEGLGALLDYKYDFGDFKEPK